MKKLLEKYPVLKALDEAFKKQRLRIFVLLYISPITPFNDIGYWMNNFHSTFRHSSLTLITILPGAVLYCFIGATAGSLTESENAADGPAAIASIVVGSVFGLLAIFAVSFIMQRKSSIRLLQNRNNMRTRRMDFQLRIHKLKRNRYLHSSYGMTKCLY